jgi:hypothetical protein
MAFNSVLPCELTEVIGIQIFPKETSGEINIKLRWCDIAGKDIEEVFWGNTVRLYIDDGRINNLLINNVKIELFIKSGNDTEGIPMLSWKFSNTPEKYIEIKIKDRWELSKSLKWKKEANLVCKISGIVKEYSSNIKISEFKVEDGLITDGPFITSLPQGHSLLTEGNNTSSFMEFDQKVNAIILHRTTGDKIGTALNSATTKKDAAHFYVDKDGKIYQMISLLRTGTHVGMIRKKPNENEKSEKNKPKIKPD